MEKRLRIVFEVLIVVVLVTYYLIRTVIPDLKKIYGSSDHILNTQEYHSMVEILIDEDFDVCFVLNSEDVVFHLLFFDKNAVSLYNQDIENHNIEDAIDKSISILLSNNYLQNDSSISIISYGDLSNRFMESFQFSLTKNFLSPSISFIEGDIVERGKKIDSTVSDWKTALEGMDYYSKDISFHYSSKEQSTSFNPSSSARKVYRKIEDYASSQNIRDMEKDQVVIMIQSIPTNAQYYPSDNSWYYISNGRVYAYIEFLDHKQVYGYCFQGSIDSIKEGKCES